MRRSASRRDPAAPQDADAASQVSHLRIGVRPESLEGGEMPDPPPDRPVSQDCERSHFDREFRVIQKRREEFGPVVSAKLERGRHRLPQGRPWTSRGTIENRQGPAELHMPTQQNGPNRERNRRAGIR